jgi:hypothetical protein
VTPRPTAAQLRLLERLASGSVIRMPTWSKSIQLVTVGTAFITVPTATFRVLLGRGWIARASGPADQVPSYGLSEAGQRLLDR